MDKNDYQERYDRWWYGKLCRPAGADYPFKRVAAIKLHGPPSFVYGQAELFYEDGDTMIINHGEAFRPRKIDVEVQDE